MPRKSVASIASSLAFPNVSGASECLRAPAGLTEAERSLFVAVVADHPASHFKASDAALLAIFVRAILTERAASVHLKKGGYVIDGKPSPWLSVWATANKSMLALARALRLSPLARSPNRPTRPTRSAQALSIYERMRLEESDNDDKAGTA
jgi:phage terminase small subunit